MENIQGGNSSAIDARVASIGTGVHFGRGMMVDCEGVLQVSKTGSSSCSAGSIVTT